MNFGVVMEAEAEREFIDAVNFYDERQPGVGQRFARDLRAFFKVACKNPERFRLVSRLTRKARLPKPWPYSVFFVIKPAASQIIISTLWHDSRNPAELRRRLK
jgi:plasmid stabilization system protein ParE